MLGSAEPLIVDEFTGQPPGKRLLARLLAKRREGATFVGAYCSYAPAELFHAMGLVPVSLCAFSNKTIDAAETVLPANLCPLVKSSFGFILTDTCPFFGLSDVVVAETTCDGKKKMFELIAGRKPLFVMDLPQLPDEPEALETWTAVIGKLRRFLERALHATTDDARIEAALKDSNATSRLMNRVFDYAALRPPVVGWRELYEVLCLVQSASGAELRPLLDDVLDKLAARKRAGYAYGAAGAPRVMVTGCPIGGDATKVLTIIEEAGGVVVALDACSGMKCYQDEIEEDTGAPVRAIAARYLKIPCSCMTPNDRRLEKIDRVIERFAPDAVVDVVLHACHAYNIESHKVGQHVQAKHGLPFLKIVTDYSDHDTGQLRTRIEALLEAGSDAPPRAPRMQGFEAPPRPT